MLHWQKGPQPVLPFYIYSVIIDPTGILQRPILSGEDFKSEKDFNLEEDFKLREDFQLREDFNSDEQSDGTPFKD